MLFHYELYGTESGPIWGMYIFYVIDVISRGFYLTQKTYSDGIFSRSCNIQLKEHKHVLKLVTHAIENRIPDLHDSKIIKRNCIKYHNRTFLKGWFWTNKQNSALNKVCTIPSEGAILRHVNVTFTAL